MRDQAGLDPSSRWPPASATGLGLQSAIRNRVSPTHQECLAVLRRRDSEPAGFLLIPIRLGIVVLLHDSDYYCFDVIN
jgi:hypothetical protein